MTTFHMQAEANFQMNVVRMLRATGFFVFAISNGWGKMNVRQATRAKMQGIMPGVSDLVILLPKGQVYFVELKNPNGKGRQSPAQSDFENRVKGMGHNYLIWDNFFEVEEFIKGHHKEVLEDLKVGGTSND